MAKVWLLVLSMAALTIAFDATIIQTQGPGHSSTEVVLNLGSQGQPIQDMKPLMAHMQRLAAHMNNVFGGNPLDLDSLFRDTVNHFHAMQQALLGAHPPPQIDHHRSLMEHIAHRPQCPKVAVAAACHCLLHQCLHQVLPQILPGTDAWGLAYGCLLKHKQFASSQCNAVLTQTAVQLSHSAPQQLVQQKSSPPAAEGPDQEGCWQKQSGRWCPGPYGWHLVPPPTSTPTEQPTEHPTESPTEAVDDSQYDRYDRQPRYRGGHRSGSLNIGLRAHRQREEDDSDSDEEYEDKALSSSRLEKGHARHSHTQLDEESNQDDESDSDEETAHGPSMKHRLKHRLKHTLHRTQEMYKATEARLKPVLHGAPLYVVLGLLLLLVFAFLAFCCCTRSKKSDSLEHTYTFLLSSDVVSSEDQL